MLLLYIVIISIATIFFVWVFSQIMGSIFFGIPDILMLKKRKILNDKASVLTYVLTVLFYSALTFVLLKLFEKNLSQEWFEAIEIGALVGFFYSFSIFSKKNKKLLHRDLMENQKSNYGNLINDLIEISSHVTDKILERIKKDTFKCKVNLYKKYNVSMLYCFCFGIYKYSKNGYIDNENAKSYVISGLLLRLSRATDTDYDELFDLYYTIFVNNDKYFNMEINEKMRVEFGVTFLRMMVPNYDTSHIDIDSNEIYDLVDFISLYIFALVLGNDIDFPDNKGITLSMSEYAIRGVLSSPRKVETDNKKDKELEIDSYQSDDDIYDEDLEDMYDSEDYADDEESLYDDIDENDEFFKEEFEFSYAKVKKVLKKLGYDNYATFKKEVYNSKKIKRKKFEEKEEEIDYLVKALGYDDFEDFYTTNI